MNWKLFTLSFIWSLICVGAITIFSFIDKESLIDGLEIKNICDVMHNFVVDDIRDVGGPFTLLMIAPLFYYCLRRKTRAWYLYAMTLFLVILWIWRFFWRFHFC